MRVLILSLRNITQLIQGSCKTSKRSCYDKNAAVIKHTTILHVETFELFEAEITTEIATT